MSYHNALCSRRWKVAAMERIQSNQHWNFCNNLRRLGTESEPSCCTGPPVYRYIRDNNTLLLFGDKKINRLAYSNFLPCIKSTKIIYVRYICIAIRVGEHYVCRCLLLMYK
jgi:hypothetical protein